MHEYAFQVICQVRDLIAVMVLVMMAMMVRNLIEVEVMVRLTKRTDMTAITLSFS